MNAQRIFFVVLSVVGFLAWLGFQYLMALGAAFGSNHRVPGAGDVVWVFVVVGLITAACAIGAFFLPVSTGRLVALAPLVLIILAHGFIVYREKAIAGAYWRRRAAESEARERKLDWIPRDYVDRNPDPAPDAYKLSFLTHDRDAGVIVRIDVTYAGMVYAAPIGKIDGAHLDLVDESAGFVNVYGGFVDAEGKTLVDRYTIRRRPGQDRKTYRLERYKN
jgi:hypothetical protein